MGRVLQTLEPGVAEQHDRIFTSDNGGEPSPNVAFHRQEDRAPRRRLRIPALSRWPGLAAGSTTEQVAITMDWIPTLLAAAGASPIRHIPLMASASYRR